MTQYLYYPGCSMESSGRAYHDSIQVVNEKLNIDFEEIDDWNCCGATEYLAISQPRAYALIGRNLALASQQSKTSQSLVAPCSACYLNLSKVDHQMKVYPKIDKQVNSALAAGNLNYKPGSLEVRHLLDIIYYEVGLETVKSKVVRPLHGLRVVPYLGCMVPRPDYQKRFSDYNQPMELDKLMEALGAQVVDYQYKTTCCGGHIPHISPNTAYELIRRLLYGAERTQADIMVTVCPMCQLNLDAYQSDTNRHFNNQFTLPVVFFTQLMGLAFGAEPDQVGIGRELIDARSVIQKALNLPPPPPEEPAKKPKKAKQTGLPMPVMPGPEEVKK
jgi:heterodisulfide reductase subunit B2